MKPWRGKPPDGNYMPTEAIFRKHLNKLPLTEKPTTGPAAEETSLNCITSASRCLPNHVHTAAALPSSTSYFVDQLIFAFWFVFAKRHDVQRHDTQTINQHQDSPSARPTRPSAPLHQYDRSGFHPIISCLATMLSPPCQQFRTNDRQDQRNKGDDQESQAHWASYKDRIIALGHNQGTA